MEASRPRREKGGVMMKRALAFFILCFFTLSVEAFADPFGKVTHVEGRVDVLRVGTNLTVPVSLGDPVEKGDIFRAKTESRAEITLVNLNVLRIGPGTRIEIKEATAGPGNNNTVVGLFRGKIQALAPDELAKKVVAFTEGRKFEVHTENAVVGIRDTNMLVGFEKGVTGVIFVSGKGYIYNPQLPDKIVSVVAGYTSIVTGAGVAPTQAAPALDKQVKAFLQQVSATRTRTAPPGGSPAPGDTGLTLRTAASQAQGSDRSLPAGIGNMAAVEEEQPNLTASAEPASLQGTFDSSQASSTPSDQSGSAMSVQQTDSQGTQGTLLATGENTGDVGRGERTFPVLPDPCRSSSRLTTARRSAPC